MVEGMEGKAICNYRLFLDYIEICTPGTVWIITDPEDIQTIKSWIATARNFESTTEGICSYIEYMLNYGQNN